MWSLILGLVGKVFVPIFDWWMRKTAHDEAQKKDYIAFLEIMQRKAVVSVKMRLEAQNQIQAIKDQWAKEEADAQKQ